MKGTIRTPKNWRLAQAACSLLLVVMLSGLLPALRASAAVRGLSAIAAAPVANDDSGPGFVTDEDTAFTLADVLANDTDPDSDTLFVDSFDISGTIGLVTFALPSPGGTLDPTFDGDGRITTDFFGNYDIGQALAVQPDGKIVVAGYADNGGDFDFALVRYNPDGSLDTSFDGDGRVITNFFGYWDQAQAIVLQPDGKLVAAGYADGDGNEDFALARYNPDGSLDTSFDGDGRVTTDFWGSDDHIQALALQPDGKLVAAGYADYTSSYDFILARYNSDGSLDTSFDSDGRLVTDFFGEPDRAYALAQQPDGKIVVSGFACNGGPCDIALARYNPDGSLDTSFDDDGMLTTNFFGRDEIAYALALQPDGKLVAAGYAWDGNDHYFALVRYNPDGSLDVSFNGDGRVTTDFGAWDRAYAIILQPDGKLVAAGDVDNGNDSDFALARYNPDGSLDTSFDGDGRVTTDFGSSADAAYALARQPDGKLIAAGFAGNGFTSDFALARYEDGSSSFFYDPNGQFEWLASGEVATDTFTYVVSDGALTDTATVSVTVLGVNDAPLLTPIGSQAGDELALISFDANASDPDLSDILAFSLDPGAPSGAVIDPASGAFTWTPTEAQGPGLYTVTVRVTDDSASALDDSETIQIAVNEVNIAPAADAGADQTADEGQVVQFSGSYVDPGRQLSVTSHPGRSSSALSVNVVTALAVAWDFGDGASASGTLTPTHTYADDGIYTVTLVVTDDLGGVGMDTLLVTVANVAPALTPIANQRVMAGASLSVTATYNDPGLLDTHTAVIDWGDGFTETISLPAGSQALPLQHTYAAAGRYTVTITLTDDGSVDTAAFIVIQFGHRLYLPCIAKERRQ